MIVVGDEVGGSSNQTDCGHESVKIVSILGVPLPRKNTRIARRFSSLWVWRFSQDSLLCVCNYFYGKG